VSRSSLRLCALALGVLAVVAALWSPLDRMADRSFAAHMAQHMLLIFVAAPLLLLAQPLRIAFRSTPQPMAKRLAAAVQAKPIAWLTSPIVSWLAYTAILWGVHFSALYERALERPAVHVAEHALLFGGALLFWQPLIPASPGARTLSHPLRMLYLFASIPPAAFLGLALYQTRYLLYPHYLATAASPAAALADQHAGGALMWIGGGLFLFAGFMLAAGAWAAHARREAVQVDRSLVSRTRA
jgi:putative membrane protein